MMAANDKLRAMGRQRFPGYDGDPTAAEKMREAARQIRATGHAATEGPWERNPDHGGIWRQGEEMGRAPALIASPGAVWIQDATHITSWHPGITQLVANLLYACANAHDAGECGVADEVLAFVHAYLNNAVNGATR